MPDAVKDSSHGAIVARKDVLGGTVDTQVGNGGSGGEKRPQIAHVSANIVPLRSILKVYAQEAYKQLATVVEALAASAKQFEDDAGRKRRFLRVLVGIRQDLVKLYTLTKWAESASDVGALIDLLNFLRGQEMYFDHLAWRVHELNGFGAAKLPNPDIFTALEVLIDGRPLLPSYGMLPQPKISPHRTLEVLGELNLVLAARVAILDDLPGRLLAGHRVQDGRVYFSVANEFQVLISVANDAVVVSSEEYEQSPFFFVDFHFLFGILPETTLITRNVITRLPAPSFARLEAVLNQVLLSQGLKGLYEVLHRYLIAFKLHLLGRQLRNLALNLKWRGALHFTQGKPPQQNIIIINYWSDHYLSRKYRSFIELGIDKTHQLAFRWFKNGRWVRNHGLQWPRRDNSREDDLLVEVLLTMVASAHAAVLMETIRGTVATLLEASSKNSSLLKTELFHELLLLLLVLLLLPLEGETGLDSIKMITSHQMLVQLTPTKSAVLAINPLTGFFYFVDPLPLQQQLTRSINSPPPGTKTTGFEREMAQHIARQLLQLRVETFKREINSKLMATEWIPNDIIALLDTEEAKLRLTTRGVPSTLQKLQFYRRSSWPAGWFLLNMLNGADFAVHQWVARIKLIRGEWRIQWFTLVESDQNLELSGDNNASADAADAVVATSTAATATAAPSTTSGGYLFTYEFCGSLLVKCSHLIMDHIVEEELTSRNIKYVNIKGPLDRFGVKAPSPGPNVSIYETILGLYNTGNLLPLRNSATIIFLQVKVCLGQPIGGGNSKSGNSLKLCLFGQLRNFDFEWKQDLFEITNSSFSMRDSASVSGSTNDSILANVFGSLSKLSHLASTVNQLVTLNTKNVHTKLLVEIRFGLGLDKGNFSDFSVNLDNNRTVLNILEPKDGTSNQNTAQAMCTSILLEYLNRYLNSGTNPASLSGVLRYLQKIIPVVRTTTGLVDEFQEKQKKKNKLVNGITQATLDLTFGTFDLFKLVFGSNYFVGNQRRMNKDRLVVKVTLNTSKFVDNGETLLFLVLYRQIAQEGQQRYRRILEGLAQKFAEMKGVGMINLNQEVLVKDTIDLEKVLRETTEVFLNVLNE